MFRIVKGAEGWDWTKFGGLPSEPMVLACRSHYQHLYVAYGDLATHQGNSGTCVTDSGFATPYDGGFGLTGENRVWHLLGKVRFDLYPDVTRDQWLSQTPIDWQLIHRGTRHWAFTRQPSVVEGDYFEFSLVDLWRSVVRGMLFGDPFESQVDQIVNPESWAWAKKEIPQLQSIPNRKYALESRIPSGCGFIPNNHLGTEQILEMILLEAGFDSCWGQGNGGIFPKTK